jgi:hypothetical protein
LLISGLAVLLLTIVRLLRLLIAFLTIARLLWLLWLLIALLTIARLTILLAAIGIGWLGLLRWHIATAILP